MDVAPLTITVKDDLAVVLDDGDKQTPIDAADLPRVLRAKLGSTTQKSCSSTSIRAFRGARSSGRWTPSARARR